MNTIQFKRSAVAMAALLLISQAHAEKTLLESVVVTGKTEQADSITKPFSIIRQQELNSSGASTVGDALRYQPGMSATDFGPNSSRPIVRGQDADRIRILRNSAATVDASALSFDHALPFDPFALHQVEILRGPAALAYGGNAVGGAVNLIDQRIARTPIQGLQGELNLLAGGPADQTAAGFKLGAGLGQGISLHLDGFKRNTRDLKTPVFTEPGSNGITGDRTRNTSSRSDGASIAASFNTGNGYVGFSAETYDSEYGVPKKLDVRIGMNNERQALEGEQKFAGAAIENLKYRLAKTDYKHQEFEEGAPATLFTNDGLDGRLEATLKNFSVAGLNVSTTAGVQFERTDFSAVGEEAFVPSTSTRQTGVFTLFRVGGASASTGVFELGLRAEHVDVNSASSGESQPGGPVAAGSVGNGPALNRSFSPNSMSVGYTKPIGGGWSLGASLSQVERAPSSFELYADGLHVATDAYEKGNADLREERSRHVEFTSNWVNGESRFNATVFASRFNNYIALIQRTGDNSVFIEDTEEIPVFDFTAVPARFHGLELGYETSYSLGAGKLKPAIQYDLVRARRTDGGGNLPRISPQRVVASTAYSQNKWTFTPEVIWVDDSKAGAGDTEAAGYELVNFKLSRSFNLGNTGGEVFASLQNLTNELAFSATAINTIRDFTPLAGRSALLGVKLAF